MKDGAHTHGSGGSGLGLAVIIALVLLVASSAGAVVHTAEHALDVFLHIVLITLAGVAALAVATGIGLVAWHRHRTPPAATCAARVESRVSAPQRPVETPVRNAVAPPQIHLHLHGPVSADDVAELIARQNYSQGTEAALPSRPDENAGNAAAGA